jgi:hypothetical protein
MRREEWLLFKNSMQKEIEPEKLTKGNRTPFWVK